MKTKTIITRCQHCNAIIEEETWSIDKEGKLIDFIEGTEYGFNVHDPQCPEFLKACGFSDKEILNMYFKS